MLETTDSNCQLSNDGTICQLHNSNCELLEAHQLSNNDIYQLPDDDDDGCQLWNDEDEESLYELERDEYYENVLAPQLNTLNRR